MSQEPVLVRMSEIVPRAVTEEAWRSMYVTRRLIAQYGKTPGCPGCENLGEKNGPSHSTECRQRIQDQMSNTSEGKTKLSEEQKRRDAFTARRMMSASHVPVAESPSSSIEHEKRAQPSKRARIASEADSSYSTVMQDVTTQGSPRTDPTSETSMRDSSKRQADVDIEELEQDANDESNEAVTLGHDVEMGAGSQGEQAPGLSGVNVAESKSSPRATQPKTITRSKESSIMNIASVCPVTGICYDFSKLEDRNRAVSRLCSEKPYVLITSPLHSNSFKPAPLNIRRKRTSDREQVTQKARELLEFICKLIMIQHRDKRYFIHEHPDDTHLWHDQCVQEVLSVTQATVTKFDRCQFGSLNADNIGLKKHHGIRSRFISTMPAIDAVFGGRLRQEGHEHAQSSGSEARDAQACPPQLYKTIMSAIELQRKWDERGIKLLATIEAEGDIPARGANIPEEESTSEILEAWDDASGEDLDPATVLAARREEIEYYKEMGAFTKVPISQCIARTGRKPVGVRWRDINKGDRYNVNVRSRLVAKEFNNKKCDDLFAGTPPVEAMRAIISMAASGATPKTLMTVDVSRAYMYAKCRNEMYVELCPEAHEEDGDEKCCWRLEKAMYGTRSAAQDWQHEIKRRMSSIGYLQGKSNPCLFYNPSSEVACLVHGDDFLAAGEESALKQFKEQLAKEWKIKHTHIGEAEHLGKHMRVLNRIVRIHPRRGITIEPDPRHAEILIRDLDGDSGRLVTTLMTKDSIKESVESITEDVYEKVRNGKIKGGGNRTSDYDELDDAQITRYRALVARANYLAVDRGDIAFCVKELPRCMSSPSRQDWDRLQRLARYLRHKPRCVLWYAYQGTTDEVTCFTDSDWAGCKRTRRSTSGGCMLWGSHPIKMWSRTQALVSLSSAEAELYAAIKACSETLGFLPLLQDYQVHAVGKVMSDASAALGIIKRQGLGRTRHIHTSYLWIQHVNERGINFSKVPFSENCADLFTKPLTRESAEHLSELVGMEFPEGHDEIAFTINFIGQSRRHISPSIQSSLQDLGLSGTYFIWPRMDLKSKCFQTSAKGGPSWKDVEARVTLDASSC